MRHNVLKERLTAGQQMVNAWISLDSDHVAEVLSHAGFDSVTVDLQHGMFGIDRAISMLRAVSAGPAVPMARCARNDAAQIGKLLDAGAYGIICPSVDDADQARALVDACRYPGEGSRSFGPARGLLYGGADYVQHANAEILIWAMIESPAAVQNAAEILNTPSLDGVYIGPNDLAFALGITPHGEIGPQVLSIIEQIVTMAHAADRFVGVFTADGHEARRLLQVGVDLVTPGNDVGLINAAATARLTQIRQH